jgi:cellulose biosynthesis protein BcsQ
MHQELMEAISFLNNKGGVGKTTLCCNIGQALAITGKKVLCIDNDSQHSLSNRLQIKVGKVNIKHLYKDYNDAADYVPFLEKAIFQTHIPRLHCLTSTFSLLNADVKSLKAIKDLINKSEIAEYYDYVLIDNHPGLDLLQQAAILASTRFFVPVFLKQQSLEGLSELVTFLHRLIVPDASISIIPNYYEGLKHDSVMLDVLKKLFPRNVTATWIPKDRTIEEVESQNKILFLDRLLSSKAVPYIIKLITELFAADFEVESLTRTINDKRSKYLGQKVLSNLSNSRGNDES